MINQFGLAVRRQGDVAILDTDGYINNQGGEKIAQAANELIDAGCKKLVLNLEKSTVINSIGVSLFIEILERLQEVEGRLAFYGLTKTIAKTFQIMGLAQFAAFADSEAAAIAAME